MKKYLIIIFSILCSLNLYACKKNVITEADIQKEYKSSNVEETTQNTDKIENIRGNLLQGDSQTLDFNNYSSGNDSKDTKMVKDKEARRMLEIDGVSQNYTYAELAGLVNKRLVQQFTNYKINENLTYNFIKTTDKQSQGIYLTDKLEETRRDDQYYKDNSRLIKNTNFLRQIRGIKYKDKGNQILYIGEFTTREKDKPVELEWKEEVNANRLALLTEPKIMNFSGITDFYEFNGLDDFEAKGEMSLKQWKNEILIIDNTGTQTLKNIETTPSIEETIKGITTETEKVYRPLEFTFPFHIIVKDNIIKLDADLTDTLEDYYKFFTNYKIETCKYDIEVERINSEGTDINEAFNFVISATESELKNLNVRTESDSYKQQFNNGSIGYKELDDEGNPIETTLETTEKVEETTKKEIFKEEVKKEEVKKEEVKKEVKQTPKPKVVNENGNTVIYDENNVKVTNRLYSINNTQYYLNNEGIAQKGWVQVDNNWYYFKDDCTKHSGWLQLGEDYYFLNPKNNDIMETKNGIYEGKSLTFDNTGKIISSIDAQASTTVTEVTPLGTITTTTTSTQANELSGLVSYVKSSSNRKKIDDEISQEIKDTVNGILNRVPEKLRNDMKAARPTIYMCMQQEERESPYIQRVRYKEDDEYIEEEVPFKCINNDIYVDARNLENLYYGIGDWACQNYKYQNKKVYEYSTWTNLYKNNNEELDELMGVADDSLPFYRGNEEIALSCAIGWGIKSPNTLQSYSNTAYRYIKSFVPIN